MRPLHDPGAWRKMHRLLCCCQQNTAVTCCDEEENTDPNGEAQYGASNAVFQQTGQTDEVSDVSYGFDLESNAGLSKWGSPARSRAQTVEPVKEDEALGRPTGLLGPTLRGFRAAVADWSAGATSDSDALAEVQRAPFVEGLDAFSKLLDSVGGSMGSYLKENVDKLSSSKASASIPGYRDWLLSELPVHAATGYRSYADPSAWMANLWIGWNLEFFVEFLADIYEGKNTKKSAELAYKRSLTKHHNMFQRAAFTAAIGRLPDREKLLRLLQGSDSAEGPVDVLADINELIYIGRALYKFCDRLNVELGDCMEKERKAKSKR